MRSCEVALVALLAGCGTEHVLDEGTPPTTMVEETPIPVDPDVCETSFLSYDNFGEPFVLDWCRGCHSSAVPAGMRQKAPAAINFDTHADVQEWRDRIAARAAAADATMPPAGGPTAEERKLLAEWLACGAR